MLRRDEGSVKLEPEAADLRLALFGPVSWVIDGVAHSLPVGRPTDIAVALAAHDGEPLSAEMLLGLLWDDPPASGANALQRHVSRLRVHLRELGVCSDVIVSSTAGYQLHPAVATDLEALSSLISNPLADVPDPRHVAGPAWWNQPLLGARPDSHTATHQLLHALAVRAALRWSRTVTKQGAALDAAHVLQRMASSDPNEELWLALLRVTKAADDPAMTAVVVEEAVEVAATLGDTTPQEFFTLLSELNHERSIEAKKASQRTIRHNLQAFTDLLSPLVAQWMDGRPDGALDQLDAIASHLGPDLVRRLSRWFIWLSPDDGNARTLLSQMMSMASISPWQVERSIVSLDGYALEHMPDGIEVADAEVQAAEAQTVEDLARALRVRYMAGFGRPLNSGTIGAAHRLKQIDHIEARIESPRYQAMIALRQGRFVDAIAGFEQFSTVSEQWDGIEDLGNLSLEVLEQYPPIQAVMGQQRPKCFPVIATDALMVDVASVWRRLCSRERVNEPTFLPLLRGVIASIPADTADAYNVMLALAHDDHAQAGTIARPLIDRMLDGPRTRHFHCVATALGHYAIATKNQSLAALVAAELAPWAGEIMGIWPTDLVIGPVDDFVQRLEAL